MVASSIILAPERMTMNTENIERNRNTALLITEQTRQIRELIIDRDAWRLTAKTFNQAAKVNRSQIERLIEDLRQDSYKFDTEVKEWVDREGGCYPLNSATRAADKLEELLIDALTRPVATLEIANLSEGS
jgi:hypothetical protein